MYLLTLIAVQSLIREKLVAFDISGVFRTQSNICNTVILQKLTIR